jgi:hypothetical protein
VFRIGRDLVRLQGDEHDVVRRLLFSGAHGSHLDRLGAAAQLALENQSARGERFVLCAAREQGDVATGGREDAAEVAADCAGAVDQDTPRLL